MQYSKRAAVTGVALLSALILSGCTSADNGSTGSNADPAACAPPPRVGNFLPHGGEYPDCVVPPSRGKLPSPRQNGLHR